MKDKKISFFLSLTALGVLISIAAIFFWNNPYNAHNKKSNILKETSDVWVYNCELPEQKPKLMLLTCADGGIRIGQLTWSAWSSVDAFGYGTFLENDCDPDCSQGEYESIEVTVKLNKLTKHKGQLFFKTLTVTPNQSQSQLQGEFTSNWDIFNFGQMMNE